MPPTQLPSPVEPPLPIDPELIRAIFATPASDESGLDAMTPLIAASPSGGNPDGVHFIVPLPPGISPEALDLFGFWTYEFRVGHVKLWSTAQGRYGRPLRVTGIQHPAPHLICAPNRNQSEISVSAPYATTVLNGVRVYDLQFGDPQTVIWFMLLRAGASDRWRILLLAHQQGQRLPDPPPLLLDATPVLKAPFSKVAQEFIPKFTPPAVIGIHSVNREPRAFTIFTEKAIESYLATLSLPRTSSLSLLVVELLPGPFNLAAQPAATAAAVASSEDPLGTQLGLRRILRTSPLTQVPAIC